MNMLEIIGLCIAAISGLALPITLARESRRAKLEDAVQAQAIEIAKLQESSKAWELLHAELRDLRDDVRKMTNAMARLEATLTR